MEAASQALRPDEEVIEARERESDVGFPAPLNQGLTAEEQTAFYKVVLEMMRRKAQEDDRDLAPAVSEPEGSASAGDAMSSERAEVSDETGSDKASFVIAMAGSLSSKAGGQEASSSSRLIDSRKERKKQRTA